MKILDILTDVEKCIGKENFKTFPCIKNGKAPVTKEGYKAAKYHTPQELLRLHEQGYNLGWAVPKGFCVVDIDEGERVRKDGTIDIKTGFDSWDSLLSEHNTRDPATFVVSTPSGGEHLYFLCEEKLRKVADDIDLRQQGNGYVLLPTSNINGVPYKIKDSNKVSTLPESLISAIGTVAEDNSGITTPQPLGTIDSILAEEVNSEKHENLINLYSAKLNEGLEPQRLQAHVDYVNFCRCLTAVNPDLPYDEWMPIIAVARDYSFPIEDIKAWSMQGEKYNVDAMNHIHRIYSEESKGVFLTVGGMIAKYGQGDWQELPPVSEALGANLAATLTAKVTPHQVGIGSFDALSDFLEQDDTLEIPAPKELSKRLDYLPAFKTLVNSIFDRAPYQYEDISILTALSIVQSVLDHSLGFQNNLYSYYALPTGGGKGHYTKFARTMLKHVEPLLYPEDVPEEPTTETEIAFLKSKKEIKEEEEKQPVSKIHASSPSANGYREIFEQSSKVLILEDEIFRTTLNREIVSGEKLSSIQSELQGLLLRCYSEDTLEARRVARSNKSYAEQKDISLNILGSGVVSDYNAIMRESEQAKNSGLANRFIQVIEKEKAHLNTKFAGNTPSRRNIFTAAKPTNEEKTMFSEFVIDALEDKIDVVEEDSSIWKYENRISTMIDQIIPDTYEQSMSQRWLENIKRVATVIACYEWVVGGKIEYNPKITPQIYKFAAHFLLSQYEK